MAQRWKTTPRRDAPGRGLILAMLLAGCQCSQQPLRRATAGIAVDPTPIVIADGTVGAVSTVRVTVRNLGARVPLVLSSLPELLFESPSATPSLKLQEVLVAACDGTPRTGDLLTIAGDGCATLTLAYAPTQAGSESARLRFRSSDPDHPVLDVPIQASAVTRRVQVCLQENGGERCNEPGHPLEVEWPASTAPGQPEARAFVLRSLGSATVDVLSGELDGDGSFASTPAFEARSLAPTEEWPFTVTLTRPDGQPRAAAFVFTTSDPANPTLTVNLSVTGGPALCWCASVNGGDCLPQTTLDFGAVALNQQAHGLLRLTSCGTAPLVFLDADAPTSPPVVVTEGGDFFSVDPEAAPTAGWSLGVGESVDVPLAFTPPSSGPLTGRLELHTNAQSGVLSLRGVGNPGCVLTTSALLDFGTVALGSVNTKNIVLRNTGTETCAFALPPSLTSGEQVYFAVDRVVPAPVPPGGTSLVPVSFVPQQISLAQVGSIAIAYLNEAHPEAGLKELDVALQGNVVNSGDCVLRMTPLAGNVVDLGTTQVGTPTTKVWNIGNVGTVDCQVSAVRLVNAGTAFSVVSRPAIVPATVSPGHGLSLTVTFTPGVVGELGPTSADDWTAPRLEVVTSDELGFDGTRCRAADGTPGAAGCAAWQLHGIGIAGLDAAPRIIDFGTVTAGCQAPARTISVHSVNGPPLTVTGLNLEPSVPGLFTVSPQPPLSVDGMHPASLTARFSPASPGDYQASLLIQSDLLPAAAGPDVTVTLRGRATSVAHQTDTFTSPSVRKTDVLLVIDNSGSIRQEQSRFANNALLFMSAAELMGADYHVGVVTTDVRNPVTAGQLVGFPKVVTPGPDAAIQVASNILSVGANAPGEESGLEGMRLALSEPTRSDPRGSAGFLRDDAELAVVVVSDDDDHSSDTVATYEAFLKGLKGPDGSSLVSFDAVVGQAPSGCTTENGMALAGTRYLEMQSDLRGHFRSICDPDWGAIASSLGMGLFSPTGALRLTRVPDPASIVVKRNGRPVDAALYRFQRQTNTLVFSPPLLFAPGDTVAVDYDAQCL